MHRIVQNRRARRGVARYISNCKTAMRTDSAVRCVAPHNQHTHRSSANLVNLQHLAPATPLQWTRLSDARQRGGCEAVWLRLIRAWRITRTDAMQSRRGTVIQ